MATAKPTQPAADDTPAETAADSRFAAARAEQAALDELEASRARVAELEETLGVTARGHAHGGGLNGEIQALLRERVGYLRRAQNPEVKDAMENRVAQVDEQLALRGYRVGKDLDKDTAEAFEAAAPGIPVEEAVAAREARQTTR